MWWVRERLLTERDKRAIETAKGQYYADIDEDSAESVHGKQILREMARREYHNEEFLAGIG